MRRSETVAAVLDLRDSRDIEIAGDDEATSDVMPWQNVNATSRLLSEYESDRRERPDAAEIHLNFGRAALEQNNGLEMHAIVALTKYTKLVPENPEGHYLLGAGYSCKGTHEQAARAFEEAVKLKAKEPDYLMALHFAYFALFRFEEAINCVEGVERIISRQKEDNLDAGLFRVWKGVDLLLAGRVKEVRQLLTRGTEYQGTIGEVAHFGLGLLALKEGDAGELAERRNFLEKAESPLLPTLERAASRGEIDAREAALALTGRPQNA